MFQLKYNVIEIYDKSLNDDKIRKIINKKIYNIIEKLEFSYPYKKGGNHIEWL